MFYPNVSDKVARKTISYQIVTFKLQSEHIKERISFQVGCYRGSLSARKGYTGKDYVIYAEINQIIRYRLGGHSCYGNCLLTRPVTHSNFLAFSNPINVVSMCPFK